MGSSVVETTGKKKLSGTAKGYIILVGGLEVGSFCPEPLRQCPVQDPADRKSVV